MDHSGTSHLFNVLHLMGDQQLIDKLLRKISYRKIPFTIDFDKILKTPRDLPNTAGSELQDVYTSFEYDHHKHDYILSGENLRSISLFEMMQKNDALKNYDGHKYNYNKLLP